VLLLLDGFDEVTGLSIQGIWRKLRDNRYRAMEPVRMLISQHPPDRGLVIAGRAHFFDTDGERRNALGLSQSFLELSLNEFTDEQVQQYLKLGAIGHSIPSWLPSRPLLVAYLASRGLLEDIVGQWAPDLEPSAGWNLLLERITQREAGIEAGIDGPTVRRILERLATRSRSTPDGLGSLGSDDIASVFRQVCGYPPDDRGILLLQRLPGLGVDQGESEMRRFIDESFAEACRAGDVCAFAENPYDAELFSGPLECGAGALGISIVAAKLQNSPNSKVRAAIERASALGNNYLTADLVLATMEAGQEITSNVYIKDVLIPEVDFYTGMPFVGSVHFQDCLFTEMSLDSEIDAAALPRFHECFVAKLDGRVSYADLPPGVFEGCIIEDFGSGADTTNEVLNLPVSLGVRVLITVLKKLFERKGRGRRENALYRGLDHRARRLVPDVLQLLRANAVAFPCRRGMDTIWLPDRSARARAGKIVASPSAKNDPLVLAAAKWE